MPSSISVAHQPAQHVIDNHAAPNDAMPAKTGFISRIFAAISRFIDRILGRAPQLPAAARHAAAADRDFPAPDASLSARSAQVVPMAPGASAAIPASALHEAFDHSVAHGIAVVDARASEGLQGSSARVDVRGDKPADAQQNAAGPQNAAARPAQARSALPIDVMGEIGQFLDPSDLRVYRELSPDLKVRVDRPVVSLQLSASDAAKLLREPGAYPKLTELRICDWKDESLQALADTLRDGPPRAPIKLILDTTQLSTSRHEKMDLSCLGPLKNLSSLTVGPTFINDPDFSPGLLDATFPITFTKVDGPHEFLTGLLKFPSLNSVTFAGSISDEDAADIAAHRSLKSIAAYKVSSKGLAQMLRSPRLELVHVTSSQLNFTEEADLSNLATHAGLSPRGSFHVMNEASLVALAKHPTITELQLTFMDEAAPGMRNLADMPMLKTLSLEGDEEDSSYVFTPNDLRGLCARPMETLSFQDVPMNAEAMAVAASANTRILELHGVNCKLDMHSMTALQNNSFVEAFAFNGKTQEAIPKAAWLQLAARPNIKELYLGFSSNEMTSEDVEAAWKAAGKDVDDLRCKIDAF